GGESLQTGQYKLWYLQAGASVYFNGAEFHEANPEAWLDVTDGTSPWKKTLGAGVWVSDREYFIQARARDRARLGDGTLAGNTQDSFPYGGVSYRRFIVDDTPPSLFVGTPAAGGFMSSLSQVAGTANADLAGLKGAASAGLKVRIYYEDGADRYFWDWDSAFILDSPDRNRTADYTAAPGDVNWSVSSDLPAPADLDPANNPYYIAVEAQDVTGLVTVSTISVTVDKSPGVVVSTLPVNGVFYGGTGGAGVAARLMNAISGTAADALVGASSSSVNRVEITIKEGANYWNGVNAFDIPDQADAWLIASGTGAWTWPGSTGKVLPPWAHGKDYTVAARMYDNAGNAAYTADQVFTYDAAVSSAALLVPDPGGSPFIRSLTAISGTARGDDMKASQELRSVQLSIEDRGFADTDTNNYWKLPGQNWSVEPEIWLSTTSFTLTHNDGNPVDPETASWSFTGSTPTWQTGRYYRIRARAVDQAHNVSVILVNSSFTFVYDGQGPSQEIVYPYDATPADYSSPRLSTGATVVTFSGTASDSGPAGLKEVLLRVWDETLGFYWRPGTDYSDYSAAGSEAWFRPSTSDGYQNWTATFTFVTSDHEYRLEARSEDNAGNYSSSWSTAAFTSDREAPEGRITFPAGGSVISDLSNGGLGITGTAADTGALNPGVILSTGVRIAVRELGPPSYGRWWNGLGAGGGFTLVSPDPLEEMSFPGSSGGTPAD
ncbi:MAG TPA: hypothetical protein PK523_10465, partial [Elusimicrobiales bacterium]|nr:hypothetical protein [Elusimicrobiales bacterium]